MLNWRYDPPAVENAMLTITGLKDGAYSVYFYDTHRGAWSEAVEARSSGGQMYLFIPGFSTDLAITILPQGSAAPENAPAP